jgi:hypothetical protein
LYRKVICILDDPERPNTDITPGVYDLLPPAPGQQLGVDRHPRPGAKKRAKRDYNNRKPVAYARIAQAKSK